MTYRKTQRSKKTLERMRRGRELACMARPAQDYAPMLPELRRRIVITDFDFGERVHTLDLYRTNRVDCYRVHVDGRLWKSRIGWSKILEGMRKSLPRIGSSID